MDLLARGLEEYGVSLKMEEIIRNPWGKPSLRDVPVYFNVSHSARYRACVISRAAPVGIDIEEVRPFSPAAARRVCTPYEMDLIRQSDDANRMFFRLWTLKESYVKALGTGMAYPMRNVNFTITGNMRIETGLGNCRFELLEDHDYVAAVCRLTKKGIGI